MKNHLNALLSSALIVALLSIATFSSAQNQAQTAKALRRSAAKGNAEAMYKLGTFHYEGIQGAEKNDKEAKQWFIKAADKGYADAEAWLANSYRLGLVTEVNAQKCQEYAKKASDHGSAYGTYILALCQRDGIGCAENKFTYLLTLSRAANADNPEAQCELGELYTWGSNAFNVRDNYFTAKSWFNKASTLGFAKAQTGMAIMTENGFGATANAKSAIESYKKALSDGDGYAAYQLWRCNYNGIGVKKDQKAAFEYLRKGEELKDGYALAIMGIEYCYGNNIAHNNQKSLNCLEMAVRMGNPLAYAILGHLYYTGKAPVANADKSLAFTHLNNALKYAERIPSELLAEVYRNIALCYKNGEGTNADNDSAQKNMAKAEKLGKTTPQGIYSFIGMTATEEKTSENITSNKEEKANSSDSNKEQKIDVNKSGKEDRMFNFDGCYFKKSGAKWTQHSNFTGLDFEFTLEKEDAQYYYLTSKISKDIKYRISKSAADDCYKLESGEYVKAYRAKKQMSVNELLGR